MPVENCIPQKPQSPCAGSGRALQLLHLLEPNYKFVQALGDCTTIEPSVRPNYLDTFIRCQYLGRAQIHSFVQSIKRFFLYAFCPVKRFNAIALNLMIEACLVWGKIVRFKLEQRQCRTSPATRAKSRPCTGEGRLLNCETNDIYLCGGLSSAWLHAGWRVEEKSLTVLFIVLLELFFLADLHLQDVARSNIVSSSFFFLVLFLFFGYFFSFMRVNLNVPYAEKDEAKRMGARWDAGLRTWYVKNIEDLSKFLRWVPEHLKKPHQRVDNSNIDDVYFFLRIQDRDEKPCRHTTHPKKSKSLIHHSKPIRGEHFVEVECDCLPWIGCEKCRMEMTT